MFSRKANLDSHINHVHTDSLNFECDVCHMRLKTKGILRVHKKLHSTDPGDILCCDYCDRQFKTQNQLTNHLVRKRFPLKNRLNELLIRRFATLARRSTNVLTAQRNTKDRKSFRLTSLQLTRDLPASAANCVGKSSSIIAISENIKSKRIKRNCRNV